ncbi:MAG: FlgO family outer membrane protein [Motiliproteus sp.]|nr:FlgO family outer membrane protein [Motiliproteus sp.]
MKQIALISTFLLATVGCAFQSDKPVRVVVENEVRTRVVNETALAPTEERRAKQALGGTVPVFGVPVRTMAAQIEASLKQRGIKRLPITITPFVDLAAPKKQRHLGTELAEGFFHELQVRGFNLIDFAALPFADTGDNSAPYPLTDFYRNHRISYVLSGTYIVNSDGIIINARVLDTVTKQVVATGQSQLSVGDLEGSLPGYNPLDSRDGMIVENGGVPVH